MSGLWARFGVHVNCFTILQRRLPLLPLITPAASVLCCTRRLFSGFSWQTWQNFLADLAAMKGADRWWQWKPLPWNGRIQLHQEGCLQLTVVSSLETAGLWNKSTVPKLQKSPEKVTSFYNILTSFYNILTCFSDCWNWRTCLSLNLNQLPSFMFEHQDEST